MKKVRVRVVSVKLLKNGDLAGYKGETLIAVSMPGITTPSGQPAQGSISITNLISGSDFPIVKMEKNFLFFSDLSYSTQLIVGATFELKKRLLDQLILKLIELLPGMAGKLLNIPDVIIKVISEKLKLGDAYFFALGVGRIELPKCPERTTSYMIPLMADREVDFTPWRDAGVVYDEDNFKQVTIAKGEALGEVEIVIEVEA